ncbi:hypothetical protein Hanom_Chr07g00622531 [Helianthus anomalus]
MVRGSISAMEDNMMISRMMLSACNLAAMLPGGVSCFRKRMHEYEEFSKKKDKMKASVAAMKKEIDRFAEKEKAWVMKKKAFLEEKEGLKDSLAQVTSDNQWLIEHGFQQVVTYLIHSAEFNSTLGDVYTKLLNHGKHLGFIACYKAYESGQSQDQSSFYQPQALVTFK